MELRIIFVGFAVFTVKFEYHILNGVDNLKSRVVPFNNACEGKTRPVICAFMAFEAAMLFQTDYYNLGMIVSGVLSLFIVLTYLLETHSIKISIDNLLVFLYMATMAVSSFFAVAFSSKFFQLIVYVILYILLSSLILSEREIKSVINIYVLASVFYAILIIHSRLTVSSAYVHSSLILFGTQLDPNYVGLPLVVSCSILLFEIFDGERKLHRICFFFILSVAIIMTSSRGNLLSLAVCACGNILYFLKQSNMSRQKKFLTALFVALIGFIFYNYVSRSYSLFFDRMLDFSRDDVSNGRFDLWIQAYDVWWEHPILGGGFESVGRAIGMGAHNTYIQLLCDTGLIGFMFFILFLITIIVKVHRKSKKMIVCILGVLCHSFFLGAISSRCFWVALIMISISGNKSVSNCYNTV